MRVGLDVGSTTIKCVVLDDRNNLIYHTYERHYSHIVEKSAELLRRVAERCGREAVFAISGSAGMGMAESVKAPFVQEVFATRVAANRLAPGTDVIIELGGEDAKILFLTNGMEVRMNGSCAGGTGAFIDQMATLLKMGAEEMDKAAQTAEKTYTIAARCGVFAKSDIQPLINQGAKSADIAKSIYQAVVNQTIAGLAQGRPIKGHVLYLGGPLTFSKCLRESFDETLGVTGTCPENSLLFVALGAAFYAEESWDLLKTAELLEQRGMSETYRSQPPLFENQAEYDAFKARHAKAAVPQADFPTDYAKPVHIGIDSGSTTVKVAVIDENAELLFTDYRPNQGDPIALLKTVLLGLYESHPKLNVASVTTTGYGEDLAKAAFHADFGVVETVAHFTAAKHFMPDVDFFEKLGVQLKTERGNRVFPVSDSAFDISAALERRLKALKVQVLRDRASALKIEDGAVCGVVGERGRYSAQAVVLATGGVSYPATGSTGDGHRMAAEAGHTVTPLQGSLVPLQGIIAAGIPCVRLQGLSLRNVSLTVFENDKKIYTDFGELLFTHFGVSGPLVLSASAHMRHFTKKRYRLEIDLKPALDEQQLDKRLLADFAKYANHDFQNGLDDLLPQKLIPVVVELSGIPGRQKVHDLTREQRQSLLRVLKHFPVEVSGPCPVEDAIVTSGGVKVGEVDPKTMESKLVKNLYFAGELLDTDAYTGGFNLQIAWATGRLAGQSAANEKE